MAVTFDPALTAPKDRIRQRIGDTDVNRAEVQDETIAAYLDQGLTELSTARRLCLDIAAKYARVGDVTLDDQMQRSGQIYQHFIDLAEQLRLEEVPATPASVASPGIIVGGLNDCRGPLDCDYGSGFVVGIPQTGP